MSNILNANRKQKESLVSEINSGVAPAATVIVMHYQGLTVADVTKLRQQARKAGASFKIAKNTLAKLALKGTKYEKLSELMKGPTAISYSADPVSAAKAMVGFSKQNEKLIILGGAYGEKSLDISAIKTLAEMPSLDELRARLIALINTPATRIAGIVQAPAGQLARVVNAYSQK